MSLDTYDNLKLAISDFLDRDDLIGQIPDFVTLAEARHKRELRIREMVTRAQASFDVRFLALPARFIQMQTLRLLTDPVTVLTEVNLDSMNRERSESVGKPTFYAIHEEIEFDVKPDQAYTAEMVYWAAFEPLSTANQTNGLLTRAPDAYLYAALSASSSFLVEDERIQTWETLYGIARDGLLVSDRRSRHSGPLVSRVTGATP